MLIEPKYHRGTAEIALESALLHVYGENLSFVGLFQSLGELIEVLDHAIDVLQMAIAFFRSRRCLDKLVEDQDCMPRENLSLISATASKCVAVGMYRRRFGA